MINGKSLLTSRHILLQSSRGFVAKSDGKSIRPPLALFGVSGRYANALYSAAHKNNKLDSVDGDMKKISELCAKDAPFKDLLTNPLFKALDKTDIINKALISKFKISDLTANLITIMSENRRLKYLPSVAKNFNRVMSVSRGEMECTVTTAKPMDDVTRKEVEESLKGFVKGKKLALTLKTDETIIGGMIVDFAGENYIDMSIKSKINLYSNLLKQTV